MKHQDPTVDSPQLYFNATGTNVPKKKPFIIDLMPEDFAVDTPTGENLSPDASSPSNRPIPSRLLKKQSPKRMMELLRHSRSDIEAARHACVLRSEFRQRVARESRMDYLYELKQKSRLEAAKTLEIRQRREAAHRRIAEASRNRQEQGVKRAEEYRLQIIEKAQKDLLRVDEVRFTTETKNMEKQILMNRKMVNVEHHLEQKREERQRNAKVKNDAMKAAAERRILLSNERVEKHAQKVQQHEEKMKRIEEMKRTEMKTKHQKSEEWERKIHQHQLESEAMAKALLEKTKEKFRQSELILREKQEQIKRRIQMQEQKLREAKERRDREIDLNHSYKDIMASYDTEEEELLSKRLTLAIESAKKQKKTFCETYQKNCSLTPRDLSKSKIKNPLGRLSSIASSAIPVQARSILSEICSTVLTTTDHEYIRYYNSLDYIIQLMLLARKTRHVAVVKQAADTLVFLFSSECEGINNASYFVRSGLLTQIVVAAHEEASTMRKNSLTTTLLSLLSCIACCMEVLYSAAETNSKFASDRDFLLSELDKLSLDRIYFVVLKMCLTPKDLELTHVALRIIYVILCWNTKKKGDSKGFWHYCLAVSLFALLQNIVCAGAGNPDSSRSIDTQKFTCSQLVLVFCALRELNMLARWRLSEFQEMFHDITSHSSAPAGGNAAVSAESGAADVPVQITRMELFHFLNKFCEYIRASITDLETIDSSEDTAGLKGGKDATSFSDAERFGLTLRTFPGFPQPKKVETSRYLYVPGGKQYHLRAALHECILLIGYLCLDDAVVQEMFSWGKGKSLLENFLFVLPAHYFTNARHILFPTVLNILDNNPRNVALVLKVVDLQLLHQFLEEETRHLTKKARTYAENRSLVIKAYRRSLENDDDEEEVDEGRGNSNMGEEQVLGKGVVIEVQDKNETNNALTEYLSSGDEKDKLTKTFKLTPTDFHGFFKFEKRIPVAFWPLLSTQISKCMEEPVL